MKRCILTLFKSLSISGFIDFALPFISNFKTCFSTKPSCSYVFALFLFIVSEAIASEPVHPLLSSCLAILGSIWAVFKPSVVVCHMGHAIDEHHDTAVQVFWSDRQISLKISVAVNCLYSHYKSICIFISIIDIAIHLITSKEQYYHLWNRSVPRSDCGVAGYE